MKELARKALVDEKAENLGDIKTYMEDHSGRTCLQLSRSASTVEFVAMDSSGLRVEHLSVPRFDERYKPLKYPVARACRVYLRCARDCGATEDVLDYLGRVVELTEEDVLMAGKKNEVAEEKKPKKAEKQEKTTKKAAKEKGESAASMFKRLIMEGKKTDDAIFAQVQKAHGLDDSKRSYVAWYRNSLRKAGQKAPDPV